MKKLKNFIYIILIIFLVVLLAHLVTNYRKQANERTRELEQLAAQDKSDLRGIQAAGEEVLAYIIQSGVDTFPGIVCWGDESMQGNRYGNLPTQLKELANSDLFTEITNELSARAKLYSIRGLNIDVVNMSAVDEGFHEILARTGARQMVTGEDFTVPAQADHVNITLTDQAGNLLYFAPQRYALFGETRIGDVTGRLYDGSESYDDIHMKLAFGRDETGEEVAVPAGTAVYTAGAERYRSYIPILFFSESDTISAEEFIAGIRDVLAIYGNGAYLVICTTGEGSDWDAALKEAFGERYLRNAKNTEDMSSGDYKALADKVYQLLDAEGLFKDIKWAISVAHDSMDAIFSDQ